MKDDSEDKNCKICFKKVPFSKNHEYPMHHVCAVGTVPFPKATLKDIAKDLFALSLDIEGQPKDRLECILQTLKNMIDEGERENIK